MHTYICLFLFLLSAFACINHSVAAPSQPLEITADEDLQWHRDQQKVTAHGNVIAAQGDLQIKSDEMTAAYDNDTATNKVAPHTLTAERDVELTSGNMSLQAQERVEYDLNAKTIRAFGGAKVTQQTKNGVNTLQAEQLTAYLSDQTETGSTLKRIEAVGNVIITTPTETIRGARGTYDKILNNATISGNVKIKRGQSTLEGEEATIDLNTNISTLRGSTNNKRVRGVFFPD